MITVFKRFTHMKDLSYSKLYNIIYASYIRKNYNKTISNILDNCKTIRERYWTSKQILKILHTQRIGKHMDNPTIHHLWDVYKMSSIGAKAQNRKIQHAALRHLYRPNGSIFKRNINEFFS